MAPRNALVLASLLTVVCASVAHAQSVRDQVRALNQQAVEAYHGLELDRAVQLLEQALTLAEQHNLGGQELARTHAHLGIVVIAGFSDNARGLTHFQRALQADPSVQLDPQLSTPEISAIFREARSRQAGQSAQPGTSAGTTTGAQPAAGPDVSPGLTHTPFLEQLIRTPMPIYVAVSDSVRASRVVVRYRSRGMRAFAELPLTAMVNGYGAEIPCTDIFEPQLEYYVVVFGDGNRELAHAGTAEQPFAIRIVRSRRYAPPALPGRVPPPQCSDHECPPSLPSCRRHSEAPEGSDRGRRADAHDAASARDDLPRFYVQVGGAVGAAHAGEGMVADRIPVTDTPNDAFVSPADDPSCDAPVGEYCVRVTQPGFVPVFGARFMVGYFVVPRVAVAVGGRYQILAGKGTLSHMLLSFRAEVLATRPAETGFRALVHAGTSVGQIQVKPTQIGTDVEPWGQVGLGSAQIGTTLGYRFLRNLGVFATPELHVFYRRVNVALEVALGLEAAF